VEILQGSGTGPLLRAQAFLAAGTVRGDAALTRTVRDLATSGGVPDTERSSAFQALVASSPEEAIPILRHLLESGEPKDRDAAIAQMQAARNRAYLPLLTEIVNSPNPPPNLNALLGAIASIKDKPWSALQLTGEPDTPGDGDLGTAWASKREDMGEVWLELDYERAVLPEAVRIHETLKPGTVAKVQARTPTGAWETLWEGVAPEGGSPRWFEPALSRASTAVSTLRLVLDTNRIPGWNEIDAVELVGGGGGQWAKDARASSSYSDP
jgi:hypothetical protein